MLYSISDCMLLKKISVASSEIYDWILSSLDM